MEDKLDSTKYCYKPSDAIIKYVVADVLELLDNEREKVVELERKIKELEHYVIQNEKLIQTLKIYL
jgi:predicted  nucleic acid-binding Zn-ribbon protein